MHTDFDELTKDEARLIERIDSDLVGQPWECVMCVLMLLIFKGIHIATENDDEAFETAVNSLGKALRKTRNNVGPSTCH